MESRQWYWWSYLQSRNRNSDVENRGVDAGERGEGGVNWESSLDKYTLLCVKQKLVGGCWLAQGAKLGALWSCAQWGWEGGREAQEEGIYIYTYTYLLLINAAVHQKWTQHCQAIILPFFFKGNGLLIHVTVWMDHKDQGKIRKHGTNTVWFQLHEIPRVVNFKEMESRIVASRTWRNEGLLFNESTEFRKIKKQVLKMNNGDGCRAVWIYVCQWALQVKIT